MKKHTEEKEPETYTWRQKQSEYYTMGLRFAAGAYILWMGVLSLKKAISGEDGVSVPLAIVIALVFLAAAVGILLSGLKTWKKIKNAKSPSQLEAEKKAAEAAEAVPSIDAEAAEAAEEDEAAMDSACEEDPDQAEE